MQDRFDDEREKDRPKINTIRLSDGRELSQRFIFEELQRSGLKKPYMKEALYKLITSTPIKIAFENSNEDGINIERYIKKKKAKNSTYVELEFNGIKSSSPQFIEELLKNGTTFDL